MSDKKPSSAPVSANAVATPPEAGKVKRGLDPEIQAMSRIDKILLDMEAEAIPRVLAWLNDRWQPKFVDSNGAPVS